MQIYAQLNNQGTAMAETAVCHAHHTSHAGHFAAVSEFNGIEWVSLNDIRWHDCTGNDALACNVCGATGETPDLIGKTIKSIRVGSFFGDDPNVLIEAPSTTLVFTDGTRHTFVHPVGD